MANLLPLSIAKFPLHLHLRRGCSSYAPAPLLGSSSSHLLGSHSLITKKKTSKGSSSGGGGAYVISCLSAVKQESVNKVVDDDDDDVYDNDIPTKRRLGNFPPDLWGDLFDNFTPEDQLRMDKYAKESEPLIMEVRDMLLDNSCDLKTKMSLIDSVERLGFSYHYENEIKQLLDDIFTQLSGDGFNLDCDLWDTATQFRIFRQHGYCMPCDVFDKFIDSEGKFKEALKNDERGMISLYEAAHLRIHGEDILEEAVVFTTEFLKSITSSSKQAYHAILQPLHCGMQRVETRHFISMYMEDEFRSEKLLHLAKIEFNRLQLLHCQELSEIQKWWKDLDFARKFTYMKHRSVECYYGALALCHEPQYSLARKLCAKIFVLQTVVDDTYDAYATFEEIQHLTEAFGRWDLNLMDELPGECLKRAYACLIQRCDDLAKEITENGKSYGGQYLKEQFQLVIRNYLIEAKWAVTKRQPTFEEYMANRRITIYARLSLTTTLLGMEEVREEKPFEQLIKADGFKALEACETFCGLMDDLVTGEAELARGARKVTSIECYMKDYNKSREEALQILKGMRDDAWKDMNNERLLTKDSDISSKRLVELMINYSRMTADFFRVGDEYASPKLGSLGETILSLFVNPFLV